MVRYLIIDYEASADILREHLTDRDDAMVEIGRNHKDAVTRLGRGGFARVYLAPEACLGTRANKSVPKPTIYRMNLESVVDRADSDEVLAAFDDRIPYSESPKPRDFKQH
tara:strand:+ start:66 stop:395 length:330 start_codon:yes stop_codon:yes gene_type:complete